MAEELIARHGVSGLELKEVAARVGIRSPSIFAHFKGRNDLADAVARRVGRILVDQLSITNDALEAVLNDPASVLRQGIRKLVTHLAENPAHVRVVLADLARHREPHELSGSAEQLFNAEARVRALIEAGVAKGVFRAVPVDAFMAFILGGIVSSLSWHGWDDEGKLLGHHTLARLQNDAADLALSFLSSRPQDP